MTDHTVAIALAIIAFLMILLAGACLPMLGVNWRYRLAFVLLLGSAFFIVNGLRNHCESATYCIESED